MTLTQFTRSGKIYDCSDRCWRDRVCIFFFSLTRCSLGNFPSFLSSADFFRNHLFGKILSRIQSECQTVWIQIRYDVLSVLIWVQTVSKRYQQMTLGKRDLYLAGTSLPHPFLNSLHAGKFCMLFCRLLFFSKFIF